MKGRKGRKGREAEDRRAIQVSLHTFIHHDIEYTTHGIYLLTWALQGGIYLHTYVVLRKREIYIVPIPTR